MRLHSTNVDFDVIQIGYGPVSKMSALLLDRMGWRVGVFEWRHEIYPLPRAVCIDHEIHRVLHAAGLGPIVDKVTSPAPAYRWFNAKWEKLLEVDWAAGSVSGGTEVNFVHQPTLERELDAEVKRRSNIELNFESQAIALEQNDDFVTVTIKDVRTGSSRKYTCRYLIGIDGANSFVRESLGVTQVDKGFEADWLVVDFLLKEGLTARDLGLVECGQYCDPRRPTTIVPGGIENGRVCRRWEFMRLPQETKEEMLDKKKVEELLGDWIKPDQGDLVRHAIYTFRSLIAERWRVKRVFLAGDAAHVMPPFMGQGMCGGLRDVWNLAWKLDTVMSGTADQTLLDSYGLERKPHVEDVIEASMFLGSIICISDEAEAAKRDAMFLEGEAPKMAPFPVLTSGFLARDAGGNVLAPAGQLAPHGTVRYQGRTGRFDSFISPGLVLILTPNLNLEELDEVSRSVLRDLNVRVVTITDRRRAAHDQVADSQDQYLPFMSKFDIQAMLVRPDFYLFGGAADTLGLQEMVADLARQAEDIGLLKKRPEIIQ